tara:strand:+ start:681 stop:836 length:156 start_codon:yes stop_codon:yes gene_type:complete
MTEKNSKIAKSPAKRVILLEDLDEEAHVTGGADQKIFFGEQVVPPRFPGAS